MLRDLILALGGYGAGVGATIGARWVSGTIRRHHLRKAVVLLASNVVGSRRMRSQRVLTPEDLLAEKAEVAARVLGRRGQSRAVGYPDW